MSCLTFACCSVLYMLFNLCVQGIKGLTPSCISHGWANNRTEYMYVLRTRILQWAKASNVLDVCKVGYKLLIEYFMIWRRFYKLISNNFSHHSSKLNCQKFFAIWPEKPLGLTYNKLNIKVQSSSNQLNIKVLYFLHMTRNQHSLLQVTFFIHRRNQNSKQCNGLIKICLSLGCNL
jgi:hypothetical protein